MKNLPPVILTIPFGHSGAAAATAAAWPRSTRSRDVGGRRAIGFRPNHQDTAAVIPAADEDAAAEREQRDERRPPPSLGRRAARPGIRAGRGFVCEVVFGQTGPGETKGGVAPCRGTRRDARRRRAARTTAGEPTAGRRRRRACGVGPRECAERFEAKRGTHRLPELAHVLEALLRLDRERATKDRLERVRERARRSVRGVGRARTSIALKASCVRSSPVSAERWVISSVKMSASAKTSVHGPVAP